MPYAGLYSWMMTKSSTTSVVSEELGTSKLKAVTGRAPDLSRIGTISLEIDVIILAPVFRFGSRREMPLRAAQFISPIFISKLAKHRFSRRALLNDTFLYFLSGFSFVANDWFTE
jgi:hypothetical protein